MGIDDIVPFHVFGHHVLEKCEAANLIHNTKYYCTVTAVHGGNYRLNVTNFSNGGKFSVVYVHVILGLLLNRIGQN